MTAVNQKHRMGEAMKIERHGKAAILSQEEIQLLFSEGLLSSRDSVSSREALA